MRATDIVHVFRSSNSERSADRFWRALISALESISTPAVAGAEAAAQGPSRAVCDFPSTPGLLRAVGVPVAKFSPLRNWAPPEHPNVKCLDVPVLLEVISVCERVLQELANLK